MKRTEQHELQIYSGLEFSLSTHSAAESPRRAMPPFFISIECGFPLILCFNLVSLN